MKKKIMTKDEQRVNRSIDRLINSCIAKMESLSSAHVRREHKFQEYCESHNLIYFP